MRRDFGVDVAEADKAHTVPCDLYSPCAMGGILDPTTIPELRCWAVVGSANNQLADASNVEMLARTNALYAPDFIVNAGGLINVAEELAGYHRERAYARVRRIYDTTLSLIEGARAEGISTTAYAERMAEQRIDDIGRLVHITTF